MPRYADPSLPREVEPTVQALGINRARMALLLALKEGPSTIAALSAQTGMTSMTVNRHLLDLEDAKLVTASQPRAASRRRTPTTWALDEEALAQKLAELTRTLT